MNSRERIIAALHHQPPDRVPVSTYELSGYDSAAWENHDPSYARLMRAIRAETDCISMWNPTCDETFLASSYPVDITEETCRQHNFTIRRRTLHTPKGDLTQTIKHTDGVHTSWQVEHWCKSLADVDKALSVPYEPIHYDAADYPRIRADLADNGIIMASTADPLVLAADLMAFGDYTVWALTETAHFARTVATLHERHMENLERMLAAVTVDMYRICGPEYATPPFLPPEYFGRFVTPFVREIVDLIHRRGAHARLHCHGRIARVLDMILDTGADSIEPCEAPPDGDIDLADLKRRVGRNLCLMGNLQLKLLEHGSCEQVEQAVKECMHSAKAGAGYIIMPTAAPINSPLEKKTEQNYLCFIHAALKYGKY